MESALNTERFIAPFCSVGYFASLRVVCPPGTDRKIMVDIKKFYIICYVFIKSNLTKSIGNGRMWVKDLFHFGTDEYDAEYA